MPIPLVKPSVRRYQDFWSALARVAAALDDADRLVAKAQDGPKSWSAATPDELRRAVRAADTSLRTITKSAKRYQAELMAREWTR